MFSSASSAFALQTGKPSGVPDFGSSPGPPLSLCRALLAVDGLELRLVGHEALGADVGVHGVLPVFELEGTGRHSGVNCGRAIRGRGIQILKSLPQLWKKDH